jgi:hypothetical protein
MKSVDALPEEHHLGWPIGKTGVRHRCAKHPSGLAPGSAACAEVIFIPLMLTQKGERANAQNETLDEKTRCRTVELTMRSPVGPERWCRRSPGCYRWARVRL